MKDKLPECHQPIFSPHCDYNINGDCTKNGCCYYQVTDDSEAIDWQLPCQTKSGEKL